MAWPLVVFALGASAYAIRYGIKAARQSNIQMPNIPIPKLLSYSNFTDQRGFTSPMSRLEAFKILNLPPTASMDKIRENHKQLMMRNHPDNGGSTYVAAKVNEAKDILTKK